MGKYVEFDTSDILKLFPPETENLRQFRTEDGLVVLTSLDHGRIHMSISRADRYPSWDEIRDARDHLLPLGKHFAMALPPAQHYVNIHYNCFHLWECLVEREPDLIWTFEQG